MERCSETVRQAEADYRVEGQLSSPESAEIFEAFIRGDRSEILRRPNVLYCR
jgi:hypothetical protein